MQRLQREVDLLEGSYLGECDALREGEMLTDRLFSCLEELQGERERCKTLQNEMERCFSDLQLL